MARRGNRQQLNYPRQARPGAVHVPRLAGRSPAPRPRAISGAQERQTLVRPHGGRAELDALLYTLLTWVLHKRASNRRSGASVSIVLGSGYLW